MSDNEKQTEGFFYFVEKVVDDIMANIEDMSEGEKEVKDDFSK